MMRENNPENMMRENNPENNPVKEDSQIHLHMRNKILQKMFMFQFALIYLEKSKNPSVLPPVIGKIVG